MSRNRQQFTTIRTEGALLPPDILQKIAAQKVAGMTPADYHLPEGFKITEAITQSWDILKKHWKSFQEGRHRLADTESGTALTNERWLLPLFKELDYGRLTTETAPVIEERTYPIERFYHKTPIHLIGCNLSLDRRTRGARGAATAGPHSMVQEYLNRSDTHLWAFLSNGRILRLLRDNVALSRQAFVEFDLEAMMEGEVYSDFALLWLLCHQSRVEAERVEECRLEKWSKLAREEGTRVLSHLRKGVADAIEALGRGFLAHPRNDDLRRKLQETGTLGKDELYRQLLRIVYRLLFLFVAEDRELLHPPETEDPAEKDKTGEEVNPNESAKQARERYRKYYSTSRLREMSLKLRGSKHGDLWHSLSLVFDLLNRPEGSTAPGLKHLALKPLGSFLWKGADWKDAKGQLHSGSTRDLLGPHQVHAGEIPVEIANDDLLTAIRALAYVEQDRVLRSVDYRNLGSEELGSVYESLLELHPEIHVEARHFELKSTSGNERKTTGSYYTPDSLVQCLLDSALDPVVEERLKGKKGKDAEAAILGMKVCDPACGSGHFLIAAAHRLARHLARIRTGESEPSPEDHQHALRDIIGRCIYGVDINPMAVELCKVSLWIEAIEPGKPLSFLDHHIQVGNSLLGTTPALLEGGIPDDAFKPIEGDDRAQIAILKKQNKRERTELSQESGKKQQLILGAAPSIKLGNMASELVRIDEASDDTPEGIAEKERRYFDFVKGSGYQFGRLLADLWCAVFAWKKDESDLGKMCPTERDFRNVEAAAGSGLLPHVKEEVQRLRDQYQFFHWHLAYPDVFRLPENNGKPENAQTGWSGGFDVVLGNPPWERVKLQELEFFANRSEDIANAPSASLRKSLIAQLPKTNPPLWNMWSNASQQAASQSHFFRNSGRYPLCGGGDLNTYSLFAEHNRDITISEGRAGFIVPAGIATDDGTKEFFQSLVDQSVLASLYHFENEDKLFEEVHHAFRFLLLTIGHAESSVLIFYARQVSHLSEKTRQFKLSHSDFGLLNPNTRTCPTFRSSRDAVLNIAIYRQVGVFWNESEPYGNPWGIRFLRMFDLTNDSILFRTLHEMLEANQARSGNHFVGQLGRFIPLIESKMVFTFDHRFGTYDGQTTAQRNQGKLPELDESAHSNPEQVTFPDCWLSADEVDKRLENKWSRDWLLGWRDITGTENQRTVIPSIVPRWAAANSFPILISETHPAFISALYANLASFVLDYTARQKVGGKHLNYLQLKQLPANPPDSYKRPCQWTGAEPRVTSETSLAEWLLPRVLELTYTAWDLEAFAQDCGYDGPPFRWDEERRFLLRAELDAAFFHLYLRSDAEGDWVPARQADGCPCDESPEDLARLKESFPKPRDAVSYIMDTFPIVRRKDEEKYDGDYRTKRVILEIYDAMQESIRTGQPYQTRLDPPPGPPTDAAGNFLPMAEWDTTHWPRHIHPPRNDRHRVEQGRLVLDLLLLLEAWNQPVSITAIEPALLLMRNEAARKMLLAQKLNPQEASDLHGEPRFITGIDRIYRAVETNGAIRRVGENGYELAMPELLSDATKADRDRAAEVIQAVAQLTDLRTLGDVVAELTDERYEVSV